MSHFLPRLPTGNIRVWYTDRRNNERRSKVFRDPRRAKAFFVAKHKLGAQPHVGEYT